MQFLLLPCLRLRLLKADLDEPDASQQKEERQTDAEESVGIQHEAEEPDEAVSDAHDDGHENGGGIAHERSSL